MEREHHAVGPCKEANAKVNRPGSISKNRMTPDLSVWVALHEQDKKEVAAIQFMGDQLSEKDLRASKKTVGKKNQIRSKRVKTHLGTILQHLPSTMLPPLCQKGQGAGYPCMLLEPNDKMLQEISDLIEQGKLKCIKDRTYDMFTQVREAHEYQENGRACRKVILEMKRE